MDVRRRALATALLALPCVLPRQAAGQSPQADPQPPVAPAQLFAVEFRIGPKWETSKQAHEQAHFRDHSANLKRLRDSGNLLIGARYADKGFLVLGADSESGARAMIDVDPAVRNQVFAYDIHPFNVFYPGCVQAPKRTT